MVKTLPEVAIALVVVKPGSTNTQMILIDNTESEVNNEILSICYVT